VVEAFPGMETFQEIRKWKRRDLIPYGGKSEIVGKIKTLLLISVLIVGAWLCKSGGRPCIGQKNFPRAKKGGMKRIKPGEDHGGSKVESCLI